MKLKRLSINLLMALMAASICSCDEGSTQNTSVDVKDVDLENVTVTFWNPITGPDAEYMQDLIKNFNDAYKGKIEIKADSQAEANHYQRILTSFSDESTADLCMVHKSRLSTYRSDYPGKIVSTNPLIVGCGENTSLELLEVQIEGKKRMPASDFARGYRLTEKTILGIVPANSEI